MLDFNVGSVAEAIVSSLTLTLVISQLGAFFLLSLCVNSDGQGPLLSASVGSAVSANENGSKGTAKKKLSPEPEKGRTVDIPSEGSKFPKLTMKMGDF